MTTDSDARIRSAMERLAGEMTPVGAASDDLLAAIADRRSRRRHTRRLAAVISSVVLVGGLGAAAVAALDRGTNDAQVITEPTPDTTSPEPETTLPPPTEPEPEEANGIVGSESPLSARSYSAIAWTGTELVVWGGASHQVGYQSTDLRDGAAYDPITGAWRMMAPAPDLPNSPPLAVMAADEVIIFAGRSVAAWNPVSDTWRPLPAAPTDVGQAVWTGDEIVVASTSIDTLERDVVAGFDPSTGTWRDLPTPGGLEETVIVWTGEEVLALGREVGFQWGNVEGRALDLGTNTWRDLPTAPLQGRGFGATWVEDRMLVVNYTSEAATYDPSTDTWSELPTMPASFGEGRTVPIAVGEHVVLDAPGLALVGDRFGDWTPIPRGLVGWGSMVAAGDDLVLAVRYPTTDAGEGAESDSIQVDQIPLDSLLEPSEIWLGWTHLILGEGLTYEETAALTNPSQINPTGDVTTVRVDGRGCTITQRYGQAIVGTPAGSPIEITPTHGGDTWTAYLQDRGSNLRLPIGSTVIECVQPDDVLTVARSLVWADEAPL